MKEKVIKKRTYLAVPSSVQLNIRFSFFLSATGAIIFDECIVQGKLVCHLNVFINNFHFIHIQTNFAVS